MTEPITHTHITHTSPPSAMASSGASQSLSLATARPADFAGCGVYTGRRMLPEDGPADVLGVAMDTRLGAAALLVATVLRT